MVLRRSLASLSSRWLSSLSTASSDSSAATARAPTPLLSLLHRQLRFSGPISVADYMRTCLVHPTHGYYTTRPHIFGKSGDFVTSPDISPIFSEMLAVWVAHHVRGPHPDNPTPARYTLVELGPGNASLLKVVLPTLHKLGARPDSLALVEASPSLADCQRQQLKQLSSDVVPPVNWYSSTDEAFQAFQADKSRTVTVAHEFFDALPVHVFRRIAPPPSEPNQTDDGDKEEDLTHLASQWRELLVDAEDKADQQPGLRHVVSPSPTPATALLRHVKPSADETVVEASGAAQALCQTLADQSRQFGSASLIVDYGTSPRRGMTVRALHNHAQQPNILSNPGNCDVTCDVDFDTLRRVTLSRDAHFVGSVTQREFLLRMGIAERFRMAARSVVQKEGLSDSEVDARLQALQRDYNRLVGDSQEDMGHVYRVASIVPSRSCSSPF